MKAIIFAAMLSPFSNPLATLHSNLDSLTTVYSECSQGDQGLGDSCDRILDDKVFNQLNAVNTQLTTPNWFQSLSPVEKTKLRAKVDNLKKLTREIEERRVRNMEAALSAMQ